MRRIGKGFLGVDTPLFDGMLVPQQAQDLEDTIEDEDDVNEVAQAIEITKLKQRVQEVREKEALQSFRRMHPNMGKIAELDANKDVTLEEVDAKVTKDANVQGGESLSQEDINLKFLRSLPSEWKTHTLIWRNKADLEDQSLDNLFNNLMIYEAEVKSLSSTSLTT
nr:ribonuclease H-like domain-containing protein [Tanacetum cinerariifolium]